MKTPSLPPSLVLRDAEMKLMDIPTHYANLASATQGILNTQGRNRDRGLNASAAMLKHFNSITGPLMPQEDGSTTNMELAIEASMALSWVETGRPRFVLTESLAAMLSMTQAPPLVFQHLPFPCLMIEVPHKYLPLPPRFRNNPGVTQLVIGRFHHADKDGKDQSVNFLKAMTEPFGQSVSGISFQDSVDETKVSSDSDSHYYHRLTIRLMANVVAYLTQYKECTHPRSVRESAPGKPATPRIFDVKLPPNVVIERTLRLRAVELVNARSLSEKKSVLKHWVTGHWKQQACGSGRMERKMKWIEPYLRGNQDLGTVVEKILHVEP